MNNRIRTWASPDYSTSTIVQFVSKVDEAPRMYIHSNIGWQEVSWKEGEDPEAVCEALAKGWELEELPEDGDHP